MVRQFIMHQFLRGHIQTYLWGLAALILSNIFQLAVPKVLGIIIDGIRMQTSTFSGIIFLTLLMPGLALAIFGLKFSWRVMLLGRARDLECFLRAKLFAHLQTLPAAFYTHQTTGDLMAYAINDLNAIRRACGIGLVFLIDGVIINLASMLVMSKTIHPWLTIVALSPLAAVIVFIIKISPPIRKKFAEVQASFGTISEVIQENLSGIRVVKAYLQEEAETRTLDAAGKHRLTLQMNYIKLSATLAPAIQICFGLSFLLVLIMGSNDVKSGRITLGDFIAFNTYLAMLTRPVINIGKIVEIWQQAVASISRLDAIFQAKTNIVDAPQSLAPINRLNGRIVLNHLHFTYPGASKPALRDISLTVARGQTVGIIGKTGSGKSTLIQTLLRVYPVAHGQIFFDNRTIETIPLAILREAIGYVPQEHFLFSASLTQNITFFNTRYRSDQVETAARTAAIYENITGFPLGFETIAGERGITLSGGQKQRIAIARAIIKEPSILILDDSFAAVDTRTEAKILKELRRVRIHRTTLIIAHRISTLQLCDLIVVMDEGAIVEQGSHRELLAKKGLYYHLNQIQQAKPAENLREGCPEFSQGGHD